MGGDSDLLIRTRRGCRSACTGRLPRWNLLVALENALQVGTAEWIMNRGGIRTEPDAAPAARSSCLP